MNIRFAVGSQHEEAWAHVLSKLVDLAVSVDNGDEGVVDGFITRTEWRGDDLFLILTPLPLANEDPAEQAVKITRSTKVVYL